MYDDIVENVGVVTQVKVIAPVPSTIQVTKLMAPPQLQKRKILSNQTQPVKKVARVCSEEENKAKMMKQLNRVESEEILDVFSVPHDAVMYDPAKPNDYELFCLERQKHMDAEKRLQILKEEKLKLEEEAKKLEKISQDAKKTNELNATSVLLLLNMVPGREKIDDDLDKETAEECSKFGIVKECIVYPITNPNVPENEAVRIFVSFSDISSAINAYSALNGRLFAGRTVRALYYNTDKFNKRIFE